MRHNANWPQRRSARLRGYDYASEGAYFVTICTYQRAFLFGEVLDGQMRLNAIGELAARWWQDIPAHFPFADLDAFIVMPNHAHGIVVIGDIVGPGSPRPEYAHGPRDIPEKRAGAETATGAETAPLRWQGQRPTLGQVVAYLKYQTAKQINALRHTPGAPVWQRNYYEHVIRDEEDLIRIREYVAGNPANWSKDPENPLS